MATTFIAQKLRPGSRTAPGATTIKQADRFNPLNGGVIKGQYLQPGQTASANINYRGMGPGSRTVAQPSFRNSAEYYGARDQFVGNPLDNLELTNNGTPHSWDPQGTPSRLQQAMRARAGYRGWGGATGATGGMGGHSAGSAFNEGFNDGAADVVASQWAAGEPTPDAPVPNASMPVNMGPPEQMGPAPRIPFRGATPYGVRPLVGATNAMRGVTGLIPRVPYNQFRRPYQAR